MFDWDDLRFFLEVLRAGSQNAAAVRLGVDQTTVGRRLAALESRLGARLLTRTPRGFLVTAAGEAIRESALRVEEAVQQVVRVGAGLDTRPQGTVRVATTDALARRFLLPALAVLRDSHPGIHVSLATSPHHVDISRGEADLAVRTLRPTSPGLVARKIGTMAHALYASRSYLRERPRPKVGRGLAGHALLSMAPDIVPRRERLVGERIAGAEVVLESNNIVSLVEAASLGIGIASLPTFLADASKDLTRLWPDREELADVWLVVHADVKGAARVRVLSDAIAAQFSNSAK